MKARKFNKLVIELTKHYMYAEKIRQITIEEFGKTTIAALYAEKCNYNDKVHYTIYYAYDHMKKVSKLGNYIVSAEYNAYEKACKDLGDFSK